MKKIKKESLLFLVGLVYACIFLIPEIKIAERSITLGKYIFLAYVVYVYLYVGLRVKISYKELLFLIGTLLVVFVNKSINSLSLISILTLYKLMRLIDLDSLVEVILNKFLLTVSCLGVIVYSLYYMNTDRSYVHTAIHEINQSGLAIFCLALIVKKRKKIMGNIFLVLGCLTFSRNYYLALIIFLFFETNLGKRMIERFNLVSKFTFIKIFIYSTIVLLFLGICYVYFYQQGMIVYTSSNRYRLLNLVDYANYYRFTVNIFTLEIFQRFPSLLLTGVENLEVFRELCHTVAWNRGLLYVGNTPHNFLFASLRLYGICGIFTFGYISDILKKIINQDNVSIFFSVCTYAIFLSAGFNLYWLYLTFFTLAVYSKKEAL